MRSIILLLSLLAIANPDGRKTTSLDGQWQVIVDPYESGFYDYRYKPTTNGYFKDAKPKSKSDLIEYDFDRSGSLKVPGDWNTQADQLFFYREEESVLRDAAVVSGAQRRRRSLISAQWLERSDNPGN